MFKKILVTLILASCLTVTACGKKDKIMPEPQQQVEVQEDVQETMEEEATPVRQETQVDTEVDTEEIEETQPTPVAVSRISQDDVTPKKNYYENRITWDAGKLESLTAENTTIVQDRYGWTLKDGAEEIAGYQGIIVHHRNDFGEDIVFEEYMSNREGDIRVADDNRYEPDLFAEEKIGTWTEHKSGVQAKQEYFIESDVYKTESKTLFIMTVYDNDPTEMLEEYGGEAVSFAARTWMIMENVLDEYFNYATSVYEESFNYAVPDITIVK